MRRAWFNVSVTEARLFFWMGVVFVPVDIVMAASYAMRRDWFAYLMMIGVGGGSAFLALESRHVLKSYRERKRLESAFKKARGGPVLVLRDHDED